MKTLVSLIAITISANAFAMLKQEPVLSLSNVNSRIEKVDFYTCNVEPNITTVGCQERIDIKMRDGNVIQKELSSYTGYLLNSTRQSFSSNFHAKIISVENQICNTLGSAPILKAAYITYNDNKSFTIKSVNYNKTVLIDEDCNRNDIIRPESEYAYLEATKVRQILTLLAHENLKK